MSAAAKPANGNPWNLFGLDLKGAWGAFLSGWRAALSRPWLSWIAPDEPVRLHLASDQVEVRLGTRPGALKAQTAAAVAIELPETLVLESRRTLPLLVASDLEKALALQVAGLSPFPEEETVWGWRAEPRPDGLLDVRLVMAARPQVEAFVRDRVVADPRDKPEVWFDASRPVVFRGFGERARLERRMRRGIFAAVLLVTAALLSLAIAGLPVLWERRQLDQAAAAYRQLQQAAEPLLAKKERLVRLNEGLVELERQIAEYVSPLPVLDRLTAAVPDSAMVHRLSLEQGKLKIWGQADDAAALLNQIGQTQGFYNVRSPSAIQRNARTGRENFSMEMDVRAEEPAP